MFLLQVLQNYPSKVQMQKALAPAWREAMLHRMLSTEADAHCRVWLQQRMHAAGSRLLRVWPGHKPDQKQLVQERSLCLLEASVAEAQLESAVESLLWKRAAWPRQNLFCAWLAQGTVPVPSLQWQAARSGPPLSLVICAASL